MATVDQIGEAAIESRTGSAPPEYGISDKVDQMTLLYSVLVELREIRRLVEIGRGAVDD